VINNIERRIGPWTAGRFGIQDRHYIKSSRFWELLNQLIPRTIYGLHQL
jgi:hypothetical protein